MQESLEAHYRATSYVVEVGTAPVVIRIGEASPALDRLLGDLHAGSFAFITAWNPGSIREPDDVNNARNGELRERIAAMGHAVLQGEGRADSGLWAPERSFFVPDIPLEDVVALARRFAQRAIVFGRRGEAPELVWC
ncbi:MAG TPA: DUF3293 domain-containing protein [Candidatus Kapabacteria bacterium]|nr:DUF3293 domain-containing protein [Candidatus Kapabacteria bacterium]